MVAVQQFDIFVSKVVSGFCNANSWKSNAHLQFSLVISVMFVVQVYWGSWSHCMVKLGVKTGYNAVAITVLTTHILRCLIGKRTYFNCFKNYSNYLWTSPCSFNCFYPLMSLVFSKKTLHWVFCHTNCYPGCFNSAVSFLCSLSCHAVAGG